MSVLQAALRHAGHQRPVFPASPKTKAPLTAHGFFDASLDPEVIHEWFDHPRPPMLALPTGRTTNLVVVDVDGEEGTASLRALERQHEPLPPTASAVTPSGGWHAYFRWPGFEIPNSVGKLGAGVDVRGDRGYVCAPPSETSDGRKYVVDHELAPAPLPRWLLRLITTGTSSASQAAPASVWVRIAQHGLPEHQRNDGLTRYAGHLLRHYLDENLVGVLVHQANARCRPPLDGDQVDRILASIIKAERRRRERAERRRDGR